MRKRGLSLNQIVARTKRPKTSVYFHIKDIPLSKKRMREIRHATIQRFTNYSVGIKGKSRLNRHPIPFTKWTATLVSLVGHLIFDGEIKYGGCIYTNRNSVLLDHVCECMKAVYIFPPKKYESLPGVFKLGYHNVELGSFFKAKARELIREILDMNIKLQRTFLCSFFDDEGSIYFIGNRRAVRGYQHDSNILMLVQELLKNLGVESRVDTKYNEITITRRENIESFAREINFTAGVCVNGNRSNSVWKESLEKRVILRNALASYKKS